MTITGGCSCGAVKYKIDGDLDNLCYCHCESCRRASGAPFVAWGTITLAQLSVSGQLTYYRSSPKVQRGFCAQCGTTLTYEHQARTAELDIALATLDEPDCVKPECHIWMADKVEWVVINDGLPAYPGWRKA